MTTRKLNMSILSISLWRRAAMVMAVLVGVLALAFSASSAMAAIITGETASATTEYAPRPAIRAVNDSGITINSPDLVTDGQITHNNYWGDMWMTDFYPVTPGIALGQQLTVDLGANYDLDGMRIWNFNENAGTDAGIEAYKLEISSDGSSYSTPAGFSNVPLAMANSSNTYNGVYTAVTFPNVSHVRYTILDTYRGNDDAGGFSEVMFSGSSASTPTTFTSVQTGAWDTLVTWDDGAGTPAAPPASTNPVNVVDTDVVTVASAASAASVDVSGTATLMVNDVLTVTTGGNVDVAATATLGGGGTIIADQTNVLGTVAPGASIGTLSVTGAVALSGNYAVEVSGSGTGINPPPVAGTNNDSLAVTGAVTVGTIGVDLTWLIGAKIGGDGDGKFGGEYEIVTGSTVSGSPTNVSINSFVAKFPDGSTVDLWDCYYHDVTGPSGPSDVLVSVGPADPFTDKVTVTLPHVLRGDSTLDGRVMMNDALPIILNWQKDVVPGTGWEIGNFNFDNKIMMNDALEIILSWGQQTDADPPGPNPAGAVEAAAVEDRATAVYDAATGFIWLEVNSALAYLQIIDPNSSGELGAKDPDGTKPFVGFHPLMAAALLEDERPHHVGEMNFGGLPQTAGPHMYVEAMPGIAEEDFDFVLYTAALDWTDATVDVVWTPEPATMTLLLMGGALVMARRRRRR